VQIQYEPITVNGSNQKRPLQPREGFDYVIPSVRRPAYYMII